MRNIVVFCCTRAKKERTALFRSLLQLGIEEHHFVEENREGLSTCYNRFLDAHAGRNDIGVFVHDDVSIGDAFFREKLATGSETFAIQGVAGSASFGLQLEWPQTIWLRTPPEALSGCVEHPYMGDQTYWTVFGSVPRRCVVLDGMLLAVDLARIGSVRFDEQFSFHFYDLDFCLSANSAGLSLGTVNVYTRHDSAGDFRSSAFYEAQERFRAKWRAKSLEMRHAGEWRAR